MVMGKKTGWEPENQASCLNHVCGLSQVTSSSQSLVCASNEDKNEYGETYSLKVKCY